MYKMSVSVDDTNCNGIKSEVLKELWELQPVMGPLVDVFSGEM